MASKLTALNRGAALTRISVTGSRDHYIVRNGDQAPVRVWRTGGTLQCECGQEVCDHLLSLQLCGFIEARCESPRAA